MGETGRYRIQWEKWLQGLCYYNQRLFTVQVRDSSSFSLCMYQINGQGLTLLDTVTVERFSGYPRVDGHSHQVYIPRAPFRGVSVVSWEDNRLTPKSTLKCVGVCYSVGVMSPHTLCACDQTSRSVSVVSVTDDIVTARLSKPEEVRDKEPDRTAVLGGSVLVEYDGHNLFVYENGVSRASTKVTWASGLQSVMGMSSDGVSSFLVCDIDSTVVFTMDVSSKLCDKINIDTDTGQVYDCTVVDGKLWVGCFNGDIVVMSPR